MNRPKHISVDELANAAELAVKDVLGGQLNELGGDVDIGLFPDIGTVGLIMRDPQLGKMTAMELIETSKTMTDRLSKITGAGSPVVRLRDGGLEIGYMPENPLVFRAIR